MALPTLVTRSGGPINLAEGWTHHAGGRHTASVSSCLALGRRQQVLSLWIARSLGRLPFRALSISRACQIAGLTVLQPDDQMVPVRAQLRADCARAGNALGAKIHHDDRWLVSAVLRLGLSPGLVTTGSSRVCRSPAHRCRRPLSDRP